MATVVEIKSLLGKMSEEERAEFVFDLSQDHKAALNDKVVIDEAMKQADQRYGQMEAELTACKQQLSTEKKSTRGQENPQSFLNKTKSFVGGFFPGSSSTSIDPVVPPTSSAAQPQPEIETKTASSMKMGTVIPTTPFEQFGNNKAPYHLRHIEWDPINGGSNDLSGYYKTIDVGDEKDFELDDWATAASLAHHRDGSADWQKGGHPLERYYTKNGKRYDITVSQQGMPQTKQDDNSDKLIVTKNGHQFPAIVEMRGVQGSNRKSLQVTGRAIYDKWASQDPSLGEDEALYYAKKGNNAVWLKRNVAGQWSQFSTGSQMKVLDPMSRFGDRVGILDDNDYGYSARKRKRRRY